MPNLEYEKSKLLRKNICVPELNMYFFTFVSIFFSIENLTITTFVKEYEKKRNIDQLTTDDFFFQRQEQMKKNKIKLLVGRTSRRNNECVSCT